MKPPFHVMAVLLLTTVVVNRGAGQPVLDPNLPYQASRSHPVTYDVDFAVVVTPPHKCKVLKVWLPLPPTDVGQEVRDSRLSTHPVPVEPRTTTDALYGNRFAYFEFSGVQGAQLIRHQFHITVWELHWNLDRSQVTPVTEWPKSFDPYPLPEPDPANAKQREYAWMTIHKYVPDHPVTYPFKEFASLQPAEATQ